MKCIFKKYVKIPYLHLIINVDTKIILKVNIGSEIFNYMIMYTHSQNFTKTPLANFPIYF